VFGLSVAIKYIVVESLLGWFSPVKVLLVITELEPGGAERNLVKLAIGLAERGKLVTVVTLSSAPSNDLLTQELSKTGISVHHLGCDSIWSLLKAGIKLARIIKQIDPDIIQSFLYHANLLTSICNHRKIPHYIGLRVKDPRVRRYRRLARHQHKWVGIICVSEDVRRHISTYFSKSSGVISTIPNGVDLQQIAQLSAGSWPDDVIKGNSRLVFVGRLDEQKGIDLLIGQIPCLLANNKDRHLYIIGDGPLRNALAKSVAKLPSNKQVHLLGYREDALVLVSQANLFLFPSRWEGMPNAVMEAMALSRPVCSTPVDGIRELLGHNESQIAEPDNWGSAALALLRRSDNELKNIGGENYKRISEKYLAERMINSYLMLYETKHCND
tara:strand:- start:1373 stop:2527 length:1155 start_codon:yes stop_codon:yes gene_type:complete